MSIPSISTTNMIPCIFINIGRSKGVQEINPLSMLITVEYIAVSVLLCLFFLIPSISAGLMNNAGVKFQ